jgi:hypothetical protein
MFCGQMFLSQSKSASVSLNHVFFGPCCLFDLIMVFWIMRVFIIIAFHHLILNELVASVRRNQFSISPG